MKPLILLMFGFYILYFNNSKVFGNPPNRIKTKSDTTNVEQLVLSSSKNSSINEVVKTNCSNRLEPEIVIKTNEMVINSEMVNNFKSYNYYFEISKAELLRNIPLDEEGFASKIAYFFSPKPGYKTKDIVINQKMIKNFRDCYDYIEVIPWAELIRNTPARDWGITYMAYKRVLSNPSAPLGSDFINALAVEMAKVKENVENKTDSLALVRINPKFKKITSGKIIGTKDN